MTERSETYWANHLTLPAELSEWEIDAESVGESCWQSELLRVFLSSLDQLALRRGWKRVRIGINNYFARMPEHPLVRVCPNAYLLDDPPERLPHLWETWKPGVRPPRWALEIVSDDWRKDFDREPLEYQSLGCRELVVFDPGWTARRRRLRHRRFTLYRRDSEGALAVQGVAKGRIFSPELDIWLLAVQDEHLTYLRLSEDREGTRIVPTLEEGQKRERAARLAAREADEPEPSTKRERALTIAAEKRVAELERR